MNLWAVYDYLANVCRTLMIDQDECLYNAIVRTLPEQTDQGLLNIRDTAENLIKMIDQERHDRDADREVEDEGRYESGYRVYRDGSYREDFRSDC